MKAMLSFLGFSVVLAGGAEPTAEKSRVPMEDAVRVQVLLDRANFGPGKIDGHMGDFTQKALIRYRAAKGLTQSDPEGGLRTKAAGRDAETDLAGLDLKSADPVFVDYTVTDADAQSVGEVPGKPVEQAKLKWLPYGSIAEAVAERYHMDADFLEQLNPGKTKQLKAGDVVKVPNVEPFELQSVKDLKPGSAARAANELDDQDSFEAKEAAREKDADKGKAGAKSREPKEDASPAPKMSILVTKEDNMLELRDGDKLVAAFPVTVGSEETASPVGEWKVRGVAKLPNFRYDKKMLKEGERSDDFHMLPPGPNNPVGVVWIALNRKGVGIHGSDSPDAIGRNVSHGCIRLANWDIVKLASLVKGGVPVTIR
jgi:lipoprotein-anchoring transpeptidase ErfK/SrfK